MLRYLPFLKTMNHILVAVTLISVGIYGYPFVKFQVSGSHHVLSLLAYIICTIILFSGMMKLTQSNTYFLLKNTVEKLGINELPVNFERDRYVTRWITFYHLILIVIVFIPIVILLFLTIRSIIVIPLIIGMYVHAYFVHLKAFRWMYTNMRSNPAREPTDAYDLIKIYFIWVCIIVQLCVLFEIYYQYF